MHIVNMSRSRLIQLIEEKLPGRLRDYIQNSASTVEAVGVFGRPEQARWFVGVIAKVPRQVPLYIEVHEERQGIAQTVYCRSRFKPFDWSEFMPGCYEGDRDETVYLRLRAWALRSVRNGKAD